eukprot:7331964-Prymnesium_polylepis.1
MSTPFSAVCEEGPGNMVVHGFSNETEARATSAKYWHSWVLYRSGPTQWQELACGGVGLWMGA